MKKTILFSLVLFLVGMMHMPISAGDFDGSKELTCACMRIIECRPNGECTEVSADEANIPEFLRINFEKKTISSFCIFRGETNPPSIPCEISLPIPYDHIHGTWISTSEQIKCGFLSK